MTAYVTIPNTDIDAESPIDADLMTAMRDNPIAITEGASGAPKIQKDALDADVVDSAKVDFANCAGMFGTQYRDYDTALSFIGISSYSTLDTLQIYIPPDATRLHYKIKCSTNSASYTSGGRINSPTASGVLFQTLSTTETWSGVLELDVSADSGWTTISIQVYVGGGASHTGYVHEWSWYIA